MTNQEAFEAARAGDWIAETFNRVGDVFYAGGSSAGYSSFTDCLSDGQSVFYSAFDSDDSREAGLAVWDAAAKTLTPVEIHAARVGGAFTKGDPEPVNFPNGGTITGTLNATAFNTIWGHVFEKGNPHETEASQIDQSNEACLPQGPPFFKWAIENLLSLDMIETIRSEAPLDAPKLKALVRGILRRTNLVANKSR